MAQMATGSELTLPSWESLYDDEYPESWYALVPSKDLRRGQIRACNAVGKKLVLFRTRSGQVGVMDRYCPHMGASFEQGWVRGERVICPFHAWEFGLDGRCARVPYLADSEIPTNARVGTAHTTERFGLVWFYHGEAPQYELPTLPEYADRQFMVRYRGSILNVHPLLILENATDIQHIKVVHQVNFEDYQAEFTRKEAHHLVLRVVQHVRRPLIGVTEIVLTFHYVGASTILGTVEAGGKTLFRFLVAPLPLGEKRTHFHMVALVRRLPPWLSWLNPIYSWYGVRRLWRGATDDYFTAWKDLDTSRRKVLVREDRFQQTFRAYYRAHMALT